jgi:hypothetical protein
MMAGNEKLEFVEKEKMNANEKTVLEITEIQKIMSHFGRSVQKMTNFYDTSRNDDDQRLNYILDDQYVLKINSTATMWETRLQEIHRLISRYRSIGVYCPALIPALDGTLSYAWQNDGKEYTCFVEEYAIYPVIGWEMKHERKEVIEHLGILASKYTGVDLSETKSMWSIIDLAPLDVDIDEKQENTNALTDALRKNGYEDLSAQVEALNTMLRSKIMTVFDKLPRCVYQGDLNSTNELHKDGHFVGLIDFNMAGTDVNINVFLNETNWFPEEAEFDSLTVSEIIEKQDKEQAENLDIILRHYTLNDIEKYTFPYYKRIIDMFQYPNVCLMVEWLGNDARKEKCTELIKALIEKPL